MIGYIYIWISITDKVYVGQTRTRKRAERYKEFPDLWKDVDIKVYQNITDEQLNNEEREFIKQYNSLVPNGYNKEPGGGVAIRQRVISKKEREVRKYFEQGFSYREIAKKVNKSNGFVSNIRNRMYEEENIGINSNEAKFLPIQLEFDF